METDLDIRQLRESINWTQDRMARFLGVDRSSVSHMENGRPVRGPVRRLLETLADAARQGTADAICPEMTETAQ